MRFGTTVVTALLLAAILGAGLVQFVCLVDCPELYHRPPATSM